MARMQVKLNRKGVRDLLRSPEVRKDLERRARRIAAVAGDGMEAESDIGRNRARAAVFTASREARRAEASEMALTRALDAGR